MNVYIYAADLYCEDCGDDIRATLLRDGCDFNSDDETTYDSNDFPKGPYPDGGGESDCPQHCGAGSNCINALELPDDHKIGVWLENELTIDGVSYVREAVQEGGEVAELWAEYYSDYDLTLKETHA
ncbi:hypothetical protein LCGC14_2661970 [marine sediment metagenome]|uniref:Uncharacterized protein n=1 Tax=marine sediment metagenome TaxID=412755 RepID=A0A0F8ZRP2_9ZZZZ